MDREEFKRRFLPCRDRLFGEAWRLTADIQSAEDLVQDTYLRLWAGLGSLRGVDNAEAYSVRTLRNVFIDGCRRQSPVSTETADSGTAAADCDVGGDAEKRDAARTVRELITRLPGQQREVMTLRDLCGMSFEEIEAETGLTAVNIRAVLSRARKTVRQQFKSISEYGREKSKTAS